MQTVGAFDAKTHFSALLDKVEDGEQIIITKHGRPVAKLIPIVSVDREKTRLAIARLNVLKKNHTLGGIDWKTLRDEGRK